MFPPQFDYRRAETVEGALDLLAASGDRDARPLAGGHGIVPDLKAGDASPDLLVDVSGVDALAGIDADGGAVTVGALATHADLASSSVLRERAPVLAAAAEHVGDPQIRNRGTIGGNLAEADPAADLPAAVVAADATLHLRGPGGERTVPATAFFEGAGETALAEDELLASVEVPAHPAGAYVKRTHPATGYAMVGVAAVATVGEATTAVDGTATAVDGAATAVGEGTVTDAGVAATGVMDHAVRLRSVEDAVEGAPVDLDVGAAAERSTEALDPDRQVGDAHASAAFRADVLPTFVERAVRTALDRVSNGGATA